MVEDEKERVETVLNWGHTIGRMNDVHLMVHGECVAGT